MSKFTKILINRVKSVFIILTISAVSVLLLPSLNFSQEKAGVAAPQASAAAADTVKLKPAVNNPDGKPEPALKKKKDDTAWVVFHGRKLFLVGPVSLVSAKKRASLLSIRLKRLAESPLVRTDRFVIKDDDNLGVSLIFSGTNFFAGVWDQDAKLFGKDRRELAEEHTRIMRKVIDKYRKDFSLVSIIKGLLFAVLATAVLVALLYLMKRLRTKARELLERWLSGKSINKFLHGDDIVVIINGINRLLYLLVALWLVIGYLNLVLSFFPWTFGIAARLFELIIRPLRTLGSSFVKDIPDLFYLAIIIIITRYVLRAIKYVFSSIESKALTIKGFYADWALPTYQLVRIVVIVFAVVAAFPYIPGSNSPAFKGISIFLGVLLSLGSTSAVANIFAGLLLTYMRPFVIGDQVEIGDTIGVVTERRLLSTRVITLKNELVVIPNIFIVSNSIINYSFMAKKKGLLLHTAVSIGYDSSWRQVHELLIKAAQDTAYILEKPKPFVLQTSLDDFYINYEINAATDHPEKRMEIYSELHQNIQDLFAGAGIEIVSPHYRQIKDSSADTARSP